MAYGTLSALDTLASSQQTIGQFGEDRAFAAVEAALQAHNRIVRDLVVSFVDFTSDNLRRFGGALDSGGMEELDEFGTPSPQKALPGQNVGFPLRKYGRALQWTRTYFQVATAVEFAEQMTLMMDADAKNIQKQIKRAIYKPTNTTFVDTLQNSISLPVKAFANADGAALPLGPNGETFNASTHNHYLFTASTSLAPGDVDAAVSTVVEHYGAGQPILIINKAQESAIRGFTAAGQFQPITPVNIQGITPPYTSQNVLQELDLINVNNRRIGYWGTNWAEVWVKPWAFPGYLAALMQMQPQPLAFRTRNQQAGTGDLQLMSEDEEHPLRARAYEREFGVGVWQRTAGAVSYIDTGAAGAYVAPVVT